MLNKKKACVKETNYMKKNIRFWQRFSQKIEKPQK